MQTCRLIDSQKCWKIPNIWVNYWIWCYQNITKTGTNNCYFTVFESQQFKLNCFRFALQKIIVKLLNTLSCLLSSNNNKDGLLRGWAWRWLFLCPVVGWSSALTSNHWYSLSIVKPVTFLVSELLKLARIKVDEDSGAGPFHYWEVEGEGLIIKFIEPHEELHWCGGGGKFFRAVWITEEITGSEALSDETGEISWF